MTKKKSRIVQLTEEESRAVSRGLVAYANAAYPPGGSECSQASNQTLKEIALQLGNSHLQPAELKKRQIPMIKAALRWFYSSEESGQSGDRNQVVENLITKLNT